MGYVCAKVEKLKTNGAMSNRYKHIYRMKYAENVDHSKEMENEELISLNGEDFLKVYENRAADLGYGVNKDFRKNGVKALEVCISCSKEDSEKIMKGGKELEAFKKGAVEWLNKEFNFQDTEKYGNNVLSAVYHGDESGAHIHALIMPVDENGKISAYRYTCGVIRMGQIQTSLSECMKKNGIQLNRGIMGSEATPEKIHKFYGELNNVTPPKPEPGQTIEEYYKVVCEYTETAHAIHLRELKEKEREIVEVKGSLIEESEPIKRELKKTKKELKEYEIERTSFEEKYGSYEKAKAMMKTTVLLDKAMKEYPDEEYRNHAIDINNHLIKWQKEQEKERRRIEKERKKTPYER